mmetsp:Transcript_30988/g.28188  ORF Transcript_30988/g.28188 Transcript_30988/m.28188 type:complete len:143 (+) Transcript_30988:6059-6487(+)|eukprot:CAMPEP_0114580544 /NCGR_PEP_ID=MMETSP0125-20121206/4803_1 /TAXON_ID=485358 ORGANISM="Aristerostoma sp., Strain ATCC 50986" /NCGR_SAMPLE_ID=MMETSP0125 /ASSEMBLY_ACC=CAM_ASM_000245 /LENGTH=142 /DNA_ID=CAMNT_0001772159 /DNA_START=5548 /DNA_END=5976 /DNA_ORIENTATION=+
MIKSGLIGNYDDKEEEEKYEGSLKPIILEKVLRFLQLFTEGHNLDLQNYIRFQSNSRSKYNIVEAVIELLRVYYLNLVKGNYENIVKCLDTLTEFVQGPCAENQLALIDGKFFEVAAGLLSKDTEEYEEEEEENMDQQAQKD